VTQQVIPGAQHLPVAAVEDTVRGGVAGPMMNMQHPTAEDERLPVTQRPGHIRACAPGAKSPRPGLRRRYVLRDPVTQHNLAREVVVRLRLDGEVLDEWHGRLDIAPSAPDRVATSETSPRWSMCWSVRIPSSMSSTAWPRPSIPRWSSSNDVPEFGPASTSVSGRSSIRYTFTRPMANGVGMASR
jgi:hypothetical protein